MPVSVVGYRVSEDGFAWSDYLDPGEVGDLVLLWIAGQNSIPQVPPPENYYSGTLSGWNLISESSLQSWEAPMRYSGLFYAWQTTAGNTSVGSWSANGPYTGGTGPNSFGVAVQLRGVNETTPIGGSATLAVKTFSSDVSNYRSPEITLDTSSGTSEILHFLVTNTPQNFAPSYLWAPPSGYSYIDTSYQMWNDYNKSFAVKKDITTSDGQVVFYDMGYIPNPYAAASVEIRAGVSQWTINSSLTVTSTQFPALQGASGSPSNFFLMFN